MEDGYKVKVSAQALKQLKETVDYISKVLMEPQTAHKWLDKMEEEIQTLEYMPNRVRLTYEEPWHSREIRCMTVMNYNIFFWIDEENRTVWVTAVIYGRRDQREQLKQMQIG